MRPVVRAASRLLAILTLALPLAPVRAAVAAAADREPCAAPRTAVLLGPLADATDGRWELMAAVTPAAVVTARLADALDDSRRVVRLRASAASRRQPMTDAELLEAARREHAEVVVSGIVERFGNEDVSAPGRFARWGIGAQDASIEARVEVRLRVLDVASGTVLLESRAARERRTRGLAAASRGEATTPLNAALAQALDEVVRDLGSVIVEQLDARWESRLMRDGDGGAWVDAGAARGVFVGQRLEVWRSRVEVIDEDHVRIGDEDHRIGAIEVLALQGRGRARVRVVEGAVRSGDLVRPCRGGDDVAILR